MDSSRGSPRWAAGLQKAFPRGCAVLFTVRPSGMAQALTQARPLCGFWDTRGTLASTDAHAAGGFRPLWRSSTAGRAT